MKAWPHTHIGIARGESGEFLGVRFLGSGQPAAHRNPIKQLIAYFPDAKSAVIFPLEPGVRWELEETTTTEWVAKEQPMDDSEEASIPGGGGFHE